MRKNRKQDQDGAQATTTVAAAPVETTTTTDTPPGGAAPAVVAAPADEAAPAPASEPGTGEESSVEEPGASAPVALIDEATPELRMFRPGEVIPWPGLNPRTHFDPEEQAELDASVREKGVKQPALVHLRAEGPHWLIMGERRWRSCVNTGRMLPAVVGTYEEAEAFELALIENIQRSDLTAVEEARGFRRWLDTHDEATTYSLAARVGKSQPYVANRLALLRLPEETQRLIDEGHVTASRARDALVPFAAVPEPARAEVFARLETRVRDHVAGGGDRLMLAQLRDMVGAVALRLSRPLTGRAYSLNEAAPLFDVADHDAQCGCNGPAWTYDPHSPAHRRCFAVAWWDVRQEAAREEQARAEEERRAELERRRTEEAAARNEEGQSPRPAPMPSEEAKEVYAVREVLTDSASEYRELRGLLDPDCIPASSLRIVEGLQPWLARYSLVCIDPQAVKAAKDSAAKARTALVRELTQARNVAERAEADKLNLRDPEVVADLLTALPKVSDFALVRIADQHGYEVPQTSLDRAHWLALGKKELPLFARVLVLRARAGTLNNHRDPVEDEATEQLAAQYAPRLAALLDGFPFPDELADRLEALRLRFRAAVADAPAEGAPLSEGAGELVQALSEIVQAMRDVAAEGSATGRPVPDFTEERGRYEALAARYAVQVDGTEPPVDPEPAGSPEAEPEQPTPEGEPPAETPPTGDTPTEQPTPAGATDPAGTRRPRRKGRSRGGRAQAAV